MNVSCTALPHDPSHLSLILSRWLVIGLVNTVIVPLGTAGTSTAQAPMEVHIEADDARLILNIATVHSCRSQRDAGSENPTVTAPRCG